MPPPFDVAPTQAANRHQAKLLVVGDSDVEFEARYHWFHQDLGSRPRCRVFKKFSRDGDGFGARPNSETHSADPRLVRQPQRVKLEREIDKWAILVKAAKMKAE